MDAVVDGMIRLDPSALPPRAMELLWRGLTFPNPEYVNRVRFGRWVGATPEEITLVERGAGGEIRIPRGAVGLLQDAVRAAHGTLVFRDHRTTCEPIEYDFTFTLRDYQARAVEALRLGRRRQRHLLQRGQRPRCRRFFKAELTFWGVMLGIIRKRGRSYVVPGVGLDFDWPRILDLLAGSDVLG